MSSTASILVILPPRSRMPLPTSATSLFNRANSLLILERSASSSLAFRALSTSATSLCSSVTALPSHRTRSRSFFASLPLPPWRAFTSFLHIAYRYTKVHTITRGNYNRCVSETALSLKLTLFYILPELLHFISENYKFGILLHCTF